MQLANHILIKEGILTTIYLAKKVTDRDIKKVRNKMKLSNIDETRFHELLKDSILKQVKKDIENERIPGLSISHIGDSAEKKRIMELTYVASVIAKKISDKNIDKYHSCYIINAIVNILGITEGDFDEFHKRFSDFKNEQPPDDSSESDSGLDRI